MHLNKMKEKPVKNIKTDRQINVGFYFVLCVGWQVTALSPMTLACVELT